jgi:hypothetical protein
VNVFGPTGNVGSGSPERSATAPPVHRTSASHDAAAGGLGPSPSEQAKSAGAKLPARYSSSSPGAVMRMFGGVRSSGGATSTRQSGSPPPVATARGAPPVAGTTWMPRGPKTPWWRWNAISAPSGDHVGFPS